MFQSHKAMCSNHGHASFDLILVVCLLVFVCMPASGGRLREREGAQQAGVAGDEAIFSYPSPSVWYKMPVSTNTFCLLNTTFPVLTELQPQLAQPTRVQLKKLRATTTTTRAALVMMTFDPHLVPRCFLLHLNERGPYGRQPGITAGESCSRNKLFTQSLSWETNW